MFIVQSRQRLLGPPAGRPDTAFDLRLEQYVTLVDRRGRRIRDDKRGAIPAEIATILHRLDVEPDAWKRRMRSKRELLGSAIGHAKHLAIEATRRGATRIVGALSDLYRGTDPPPALHCH